MKKYEDRWYQEECADSWYKSLKIPDSKPLVAVPTGGGKTVILSKFLEKYLADNPDDLVLVLSHTQDIVKQDAATLQDFFPDKIIGVFSSGLKTKDVQQITVGSIQTVYNSPELFKWVNLIVVDEAHAVSHKGEGRYREFFKDSLARICGMSATVFRTGHGYLYEGEGTLFNKLAYDLTSRENFNRLVKEGYLCKLIPLNPELLLDSKDVPKSGGDYNIKQLAATHNTEEITKRAVKEAVKYGKNYKKWLVFAIDIEHCEAIAKRLNKKGIKASVLHSKMRENRETVLEQYRNREIRALVSVGMVTTGFDDPEIDLLLILRPTKSAVLHVQMTGRGLRISPKKDHCLVLDFAQNTKNLGCINNVIVPKTAARGQVGEAPTKTCPKCNTINWIGAKVCETCDEPFKFKVRLSDSAFTGDVISKANSEIQEKEVRWLKVTRVDYRINRKPGIRPDVLMVHYICNLIVVKEAWCLDHDGFAGSKAKHMAKFRGHKGPFTTEAVFNNRYRLRKPNAILVDFNGKYPQIKNSQF